MNDHDIYPRFNNMLISTCRQVLRSTGDHQGPPLDTYRDAVVAEMNRLGIRPTFDQLLTSAVLQAAHCAGHERRTPADIELAWLHTCQVVDDYRRRMAGAADVQAVTVPEPGQANLFDDGAL